MTATFQQQQQECQCRSKEGASEQARVVASATATMTVTTAVGVPNNGNPTRGPVNKQGQAHTARVFHRYGYGVVFGTPQHTVYLYRSVTGILQVYYHLVSINFIALKLIFS